MAAQHKSERESLLESRVREFESSTTAHGLPNIGRSKTLCGRSLWALIFLLCLAIFCYQAHEVVSKYRMREKIVSVELRSETNPFPAVTVCNMNPFKQSVILQIPDIKQTLNAFDRSYEGGKRTAEAKRKRRELAESSDYLINNIPASASCYCADITKECVQLQDEFTCICEYDIMEETAWPCYDESAWSLEDCVEDKNPRGVGLVNKNLTDNTNSEMIPCYCMQNGGSSMKCLDQRKLYIIGEPKKEWMIRTTVPMTTTLTPTTTPLPSTTTPLPSTTTPLPSTTTTLPLNTTTGRPTTTTTTEDPVFVEAMGFEGMTDPVAIITKGKENVMFSMVALPEEQRVKASYKKNEFIKMCSFNGQQCDMGSFRLFVDPTFGNCYTFNFDMKTNLTTNRAGPMFGLRLMAYINRTDFLKTTESAGLRIDIHPQDQVPFPDSYGHSAPTGFSSSFAIHAKRYSRLSPPYGSCVEDGKTDGYIYRNYAYSVEGCFRSCFQHTVVNECGCGDPRYPIPPGNHSCNAGDSIARQCIDRISKLRSDILHCSCPNPCEDAGYIMTFSASQWPSGSVEMGDCDGLTPAQCVKHYQKHAALIEVFYDQLSYEYLKESISYGLVNLVADFGGHLGLWMGFSVITCIEFILFLWDLSIICCARKRSKNNGQMDKNEKDTLNLDVINEVEEGEEEMNGGGGNKKHDQNTNTRLDLEELQTPNAPR